MTFPRPLMVSNSAELNKIQTYMFRFCARAQDAYLFKCDIYVTFKIASPFVLVSMPFYRNGSTGTLPTTGCTLSALPDLSYFQDTFLSIYHRDTLSRRDSRKEKKCFRRDSGNRAELHIAVDMRSIAVNWH